MGKESTLSDIGQKCVLHHLFQQQIKTKSLQEQKLSFSCHLSCFTSRTLLIKLNLQNIITLSLSKSILFDYMFVLFKRLSSLLRQIYFLIANL